MKISGIYTITNKTNKKMYIGQSENCYGRWLKHRSDYLVQDNPLYKDMREYGIENFSFKIIKQIPIHLLKSEQKKYIQKYNTTAPNGYN